VPGAPSPAARIAFWTKLHQRLAGLSNRIDTSQRGKAQAAKDRLVRVEQGEAIAVPAPMTRKDFLRLSGMTEAQTQHCVRVSEIANAGDHWWQRMRDEQD
jgi:hypothetical protein